ncbi:MAG: ABC transporter family substrate-binding protein [Actinomycetota bacterium]|nr:ABC transporter family substrate-binding protein [Actinomycetota bacterium]
MRLSTKGTALLGAALAATLALGACSSNGGGGGGGGGSTNSKAQARTDQNDITPTPYEQVKDGGTMRWPIDSFPPNFNTNEVDGNEQGIADLMFSTLPTVWYFDPGGKPVLNTDLVDKAEQTSTDPQVVTYHINPKAVWSDGTPITWQDFKAQVSALSGKDKAFKIASSNGYEQIGSVEKGATDQDVKLTFATKFPDWQSLFTPLTPASLNANAKAFNTLWVPGPKLSGGPFKVDKIDKTQKTITVVRNDKWWGKKPKLDRIEFIVIDQGATAKAFQSDQVDFVDIGSDAAALATVKTVAGATVHKAGGPNWRHIDLGQRGPMADVKVRQAVMLAIDREGDAKALLTPLDWPAKVLDSHFWMNNQAQYKSTCGAFCNRDVAKAKSLLESAGFKLGADGIYAKNGKPLALQFIIPAGVTTSENESQLQQTALKAAGIKVNIKTVPSDPFFPDYVLKGQFDLTIFSWIGTQFPISSSRSIYFSNGDQNYAKIGTPEIDALFKQATTELDPAKATDLTYQIDQKIWEEGHSVALYQRPELVATKTGLVNFGAFGFAAGASPRNYVPIGFKA